MILRKKINHTALIKTLIENLSTLLPWLPSILRNKKCSISVLLSLGMLLGAPVCAQRSDTASGSYYSSKNSWQYTMETSAEKWKRGTLRDDFQIFMKYESTGKHVGNVSYYGNSTLYWLNGIKEIELAATGISRQNADSFIYHVTLNDSIELVSWTKPQEFRSVNGLTYAYLGKFDADEKVIKLEIYKFGKYSNRSIAVINSLYLPPAQLRTVVLNYNDQYLFKPHKQHFIPRDKQIYFDRKKWEKGDLNFNWTDSINHLAVEMESTIQNDMYNVYLKRTIDGETDTAYISNTWEMSYYSPRPFLRINSSFFNKPGKYEILVVPEAPEEFRRNTKARTISVPFTVNASDNTMFSMNQVLLGLGVVLLSGGLLFTYYQRLSKSRLARAAQQQEIARLQLTSVRAQLNPHFMFNAMAGIQSLINKNEISAANIYLSRFARMTRSVLDEQKTDFVSIDDEIRLLHDYLQMEQMRFGFQYVIELDGEIDAVNTDIPAMVLQPFVENAVKHGIAPLLEGGRIEISLLRIQHNIQALIRDNGPGFDQARQASGKGLKLSKRRIELFNSFHKETPIVLKVTSGAKGTIVSITLKNWV
ncbi:MAG: sensor histidine kinase [Flavisolibacter sp.]